MAHIADLNERQLQSICVCKEAPRRFPIAAIKIAAAERPLFGTGHGTSNDGDRGAKRSFATLAVKASMYRLAPSIQADDGRRETASE